MSNLNNKYAINETKQAELDTLNAQVLQAQYQVAQLQTIVASLNQKNNDFSARLTSAQNNRENASSNLNKVKQVVSGIQSMARNAKKAAEQTDFADKKAQETAEQLSQVINKLIFSIEIIDRLAQLINKKKASGKLISNELVNIINAASADANNAMAATLTALKSSYVASTSGNEATNVTNLERDQSIDLCKLITGNHNDDILGFGDITPGEGSLYQLLINANDAAVTKYNASLNASNQVGKELSQAESNLSSATVLFNSLKAGYAAAKAATMAA